MYNVGKCLLSDRLLEAHMTKQELAVRLNSTKQQINSYTRANKPKVMSYRVAYNIASVLGCEMSELYEWVDLKDE